MSVSLSEQMGAMALVDQLRHRDMEIQEHLDLPRRRAEVAERIRTYYQNNGIAFDDAVIDEGVRQFFSRRLVFEAPALSRRQRLLARLFLGRAKLLNYAVATLMTLLMALYAYWQLETRVDERAEQVVVNSQALKGEIAAQRQRLEQTRLRLKRQPNAMAADLLAKAERLLPGTQPPVSLNPAAFPDRKAFRAQVSKAQADIKSTRQNVNSVRKRLNRIDHLYASLDRQQQLLARLKGMPLDAADRKQLTGWINNAGTQINALQLETADNALEGVKDYLDYAAAPLALKLVDRPGIKSGVERCYEASGCSENSTRGKSWYLIVEALDAAGKPAYVPVTSVEDNQTRWARQFGVRVSRDEYLRVRQDKLEDGHVSQRHIGEKAANSLKLRFTQRTSADPDMILQW